MTEVQVDHIVDWFSSFRTLSHGVKDPISHLSANEYVRLTENNGQLVTVRVSWTEPESQTCLVSAPDSKTVEQIWADSIAQCVAVGPRHTLFDACTANTTIIDWLSADRKAFQLASHDTWAELVPSILGQRITTVEAARQWRRLAQQCDSYPTADQVRDMSVSDFHKIGIEQSRARTLVAASRNFNAIKRHDQSSIEDVYTSLCSLSGIGPWTTAETLRRSHGWLDAVSEGDFHVASHFVHAMTGERDGTDLMMLEILEPFRPYRALVIDSVLRHGRAPQKQAPRRRNIDIRRM